MIGILRGGFFSLLVLSVLAFFLPAFGPVWGASLLGVALVCLLIGLVPWENFSAPQRAPRAPQAQAQQRQGPSAFDGFGTWVQEHGWLIAGFVFAFLSVICIIVAWNSDEKATSVIFAVAFGIASFFSFLASAGTLGDFMSTWAQEHKVPTLLAVALIAAFGFGWAAWQEGYTSIHDLGWLHVGFVTALAVVFLTVLYMSGVLSAFLVGVGTGIGKAFFFGYHPFLSLVLWGVLLMAGGLFVILAGHHEVFDSWDGLLEIIKKVFPWV
ncbi:MAG: hypothetical protein ACAH17_00625, partial [Candidatus Paceibacterota bacterium]